jgi:hypothetical protein
MVNRSPRRSAIRRSLAAATLVATVATVAAVAALLELSGGSAAATRDRPAVARDGAAKPPKPIVIAGVPIGSGFSGDGGPALKARFNGPTSVAVDAKGNIVVADWLNNRIRKIDGCSGIVTTVAGNGAPSYSGDGGPATQASLYQPIDVAVDRSGNIYALDFRDSHVREIMTDGTIRTVAPNRLLGGYGLAVDSHGNVYTGGVTKIDPAGNVSRIAGGGSSKEDNVPAISAAFDHPVDIAVDGKGDVFVIDGGDGLHGVVREITPDGTIRTIAGSYVAHPAINNGLAKDAQFRSPWHANLDSKGNLFITDRDTRLVREISGGKITTVANIYNPKRITTPQGVDVDAQGDVFIVDTVGGQILEVRKRSTRAPRLTVLPGAPVQHALAQHGITVSVICDRACSLRASGTITIAGRSYQLGPASQRLSATGGCTQTLRLTLPAAAARDLGRLGSGRDAQAVLTVVASDDAGHSARTKRVITVRA